MDPFKEASHGRLNWPDMSFLLRRIGLNPDWHLALLVFSFFNFRPAGVPGKF
jgi:hypothetical protein